MRFRLGTEACRGAADFAKERDIDIDVCFVNFTVGGGFGVAGLGFVCFLFLFVSWGHFSIPKGRSL
jgi:hypothetical protein